jgi:phage tail sheath gpL-like
LGIYKSLTPCYEVAATAAAVAAYYGQIDPARPFQTLPLLGVLAPAQTNQFTLEERNLLLFDGIATQKVDSGGQVVIERLITMYQENTAGASDTAYLDVNTVLTLSYLRWDFRNYFMTKYPRHKLANDGTRFGAGQAILTPKAAKAEAVAKFRQWEELGLVEGADQFKRDLIVERNNSDPNRLDIMLPPDLVNQLVVTGVQIGFLL